MRQFDNYFAVKKSFFLIWMKINLIAWVFCIGLSILIVVARGQDINFTEIIINSFVYLGVYMLILVWIAHFSIFPKIKYLENNDNAKPTFKPVCSSVIDLPQKIDFSHLKSKIIGKWLITFPMTQIMC